MMVHWHLEHLLNRIPINITYISRIWFNYLMVHPSCNWPIDDIFSGKPANTLWERLHNKENAKCQCTKQFLFERTIKTQPLKVIVETIHTWNVDFYSFLLYIWKICLLNHVIIQITRFSRNYESILQLLCVYVIWKYFYLSCTLHLVACISNLTP